MNSPANGVDPSGLVAFNSTNCGSANPTSNTAGCGVHRGIIFLGFDAECVCRCAGSSDWDNFARGCLDCAQRAGVPPDEAHARCYEIADSTYGRIAGLISRIDIGIRCQGCVRCNDTFCGTYEPPYTY